MFTTLALLASLFTTPAEAGVIVSVNLPGIAWDIHYAPAPRAGWTWVHGYYDAWGEWIPGHWRPSIARVGYDWVPGYWVGAHYYDGYWRPLHRSGYTWVAGVYRHGVWTEGYWSGLHAARLYERHEAREWHEERAEAHHEAVVEHRHEHTAAVRARVHARSEGHEAAETHASGSGGSHHSAAPDHEQARTASKASSSRHSRSSK